MLCFGFETLPVLQMSRYSDDMGPVIIFQNHFLQLHNSFETAALKCQINRREIRLPV